MKNGNVSLILSYSTPECLNSIIFSPIVEPLICNVVLDNG